MLVLVIGPPRSGTSALAAVLDALGVHTGGIDRTHPADGLGAFVDAAVQLRLLELRISEQRDNVMVPAPDPQAQAWLAAEFAAREAAHPVWAIKSHAILPVLDAVVDLLPAGIDVRLVVTQRFGPDSIASLHARRGNEPADLPAVRRFHADCARLAARFAATLPANKVCRVNFERDVASTGNRGPVDRLAAFVGLPSTNAAYAVLNPALVRFTSSRRAVL